MKNRIKDTAVEDTTNVESTIGVKLTITHLWLIQEALLQNIERMKEWMTFNPNTQDIYGPMIANGEKTLAIVEAAINTMHMESLC